MLVKYTKNAPVYLRVCLVTKCSTDVTKITIWIKMNSVVFGNVSYLFYQFLRFILYEESMILR